ncbi:flagellar basal body P-ring formation chaperone FlgA [Vibrio sp. SCSIO 43136]|uniref:flagellar basal body P-ring formation chaperone FlgA n=1 Tax=Vibrio sp. SCSIO 43136 TaxID=2819101 RepID=UPI002075BF15|nr:flagellar basal body P-ring formation chaperone FlgA [Vibrio sp. SCSIO 43136]USD64612.1 flagellar basal body P-ring formation protein FlgA [Vibrio sp. SCSIO 43136]
MQSISKCRAFYDKFGKTIGFCLIFFSAFAHSATESQIDAIKQAAEQHVLENYPLGPNDKMTATAAAIDRRVKASDCDEPLETSSSAHSGSSSNITVLVTCPQDDWRVYVPVRVSLLRPLVTAITPLARGNIIGSNDISISFVEQRAYRRFGFQQLDQVIGAKLKRNVRNGDVIEQNDICVVCRNEIVIIKAVKGEMSITTKGTALSDGATGDHVKVKNNKSNRIIDAIVTGMAEVTVHF